MAVHDELSPAETADRLALRELFDAYAHCADRRDADGQKALFTEDALFAVYMEGEEDRRAPVLRGAKAHPRLERDSSDHGARTWELTFAALRGDQVVRVGWRWRLP
jgi:SnoaL-like domain